MEFIYRVHAIKRMFERDIEELEVEDIVKSGEVIEEYIDDKPYPSYLSLGFINNAPLHVVYAKDYEGNIIIITTYRPTLQKWENDFKTRKAQ